MTTRPVMMDEGQESEGEERQGPSYYNYNHGQEERMFGKEITEDEYNKFMRQGEAHSQRRQANGKRRSDNAVLVPEEKISQSNPNA